MISPKQRKILAFPYSGYDAIICDGAVRSGKTSVMMWAFVDWGMRNFRGQRFGVCGRTVDSCAKNIIVPFMAMSLAKEKYSIRWKRGEKVMEVRWGTAVNYFEVFGGKDESSFTLIQGRTLAGILLDEVVLMPESFVNQALARCSVEGARFWFSCNPGNPQHWFYRDWILRHQELNALYLRFALTDNPSLSPETLKRYETLYSGVFYDRYIRGLWTQPQGVVYPMFDALKHETEQTGGKGEYYIAMDYGTINPTAMGLWRLDAQKGEAVMEKEYYYDSRQTHRQKTDEEYYQDLEQFAGEVPIKRIIIDPSAASFKECIRRHRKFKVQDADNRVLDGIRFTGTLLSQGKLKFHSSCVNTFREFGAYLWDERRSEDAVIKENDHSMDQMRYFCQTLRRRFESHTPYKSIFGEGEMRV